MTPLIRQVITVIYYSTLIPILMYIFIANNILTRVITYAVHYTLPCIVFIRYFREIHSNSIRPRMITIGRIVIACMIWSTSLLYENDYGKLEYYLISKIFVHMLEWYNPMVQIVMDSLLTFLYWSFFIALAVIISFYVCKWWETWLQKKYNKSVL